MLKYGIFYFFFQFIIIANCISQEVNFEFENTIDRSQTSTFCIQNSGQHYLLTSYNNLIDQSGLYKSRIFDIDVNGMLVNEANFEVENSDLKIFSLLEQNDFYIGIGQVNNLETDSNFLWFAKIDLDLNLLEEKLIYLNNLKLNSPQCKIIDNVVFGVGSGLSDFGLSDYAFKISLDGDLLVLSSDIQAMPFQSINSFIKSDNNSLLLFGFKLVETDLDFNVIDIVEERPLSLIHI